MFLLSLALAVAAADGPSFSCAHVTSQVNKLICASPKLSALDRELADVFNAMRGQPIDQQKLRSGENAWLAALQKDCQDEPCIQSRYQQRIAELRAQSRRAASPAAYDETKPFPAPPSVLTAAQAALGQACSFKPNIPGPSIPGFSPAARFIPVIFNGGVSIVRERQGVRIAFVTLVPGEGKCTVSDFAVLPKTAIGDRFLSCSVADPPMQGFGIRNPTTQGLDAFWSIENGTHRMERVAMGVLGIEKKVRCRQPEWGE